MLKTFLVLLLGLQASTGSIQVLVHLAGSSTPIPSVDVTLTPFGVTSLLAPIVEKTDASGRVTFSNLPAGQYRVQVSHGGYFRRDESLPSIYNTRPSARAREPVLQVSLSGLVSVAPREWNPNVSIALSPFGSIRGRITDRDGLPLKEVFVSTGAVHYEDGRRILDEWGQTKTNVDGEYVLSSLAPGQYYIRADREARSYTATYFPGENDIERASWIRVNGDDVGGINFSLANPKTFSVSGKVSNLPKRTLPDGRSISATAQFGLIPHDERALDFPFPVQLANERPGEEGDFLIKGIPAGSWDLVAIVTNNDIRAMTDVLRITGRTQIVVVDEDVQSVRITMDSYSITGRTRMTTGERVPITLRALLVPRDNMPRNLVTHLTQARTLGFLDGSFSFESVPPGRYSFQFEELPAGYYLADIRHGPRSISDDGIIDVLNQAPEVFEIVMGRGGGTVSGKIDGLPEKVSPEEYGPVRVALVPSKRGNLLLYQVATLSAGAQFEFAYVAPGDYKVFALKNLPNGAEKSSEFLAPYEALGIPITVSVDSTREVGVPLIRND